MKSRFIQQPSKNDNKLSWSPEELKYTICV